MLRHTTKGLAVAMLALATTAAAQGTASVRLPVQTDSKLWIEGSSNLHDWSCKATTVDANIDADAAIAKTDARSLAKLVQRVQVKIPVLSLKCGEDRMDKNLYKALKSETAPNISYILGTFEAIDGESKDTYSIKAVGKLTIAGVEKSVTMDLQAAWLPDGSLKAVGAIPLLISDFGVKPPTALLGTLRTKDKVTVKFELLVGAATITAAAGER
jgi:polyisoprenoid-binding protein YceI